MIWAKKIPQQYKRHQGDAKKQCPYCHAHWVWSIKRDVIYNRQGFIKITCSKCHKSFIWDGGHI